MYVHVIVRVLYTSVSLPVKQNFVKNSCNVWDQGTLDELWAVFNAEPQSVASGRGADASKARLEEEKPEAQVSTDSELVDGSGANGVPQSLSRAPKKEKKAKRDKMAPTIDASLEQNGESAIETSREVKKKTSTVPEDGSALEQNGELVEPSKEKKKKRKKKEDLIGSSVEEESPSREKKKSTALKDSQNGEPVESSGKEKRKKKSKQTEEILTCKKRALEGLEECEPHKHKKRRMAS